MRPQRELRLWPSQSRPRTTLLFIKRMTRYPRAPSQGAWVCCHSVIIKRSARFISIQSVGGESPTRVTHASHPRSLHISANTHQQHESVITKNPRGIIAKLRGVCVRVCVQTRTLMKNQTIVVLSERSLKDST